MWCIRIGRVLMVMVLTLMALTLTAGCGDEETVAAAAPTDEAAFDPMDMGNGDTSLPGDPEAGAVVYAQTCLPCHGVDGRGNSGMTGGDFVGEPIRLQKGNDVLLREIAGGITNGSRVMPPHEQILTEQQRKDALSYVRQQWGVSSD